jgi:uncharacterized membrane protein YccC
VIPSDLVTGWPITAASGKWRRSLRRIEKPARVAAQTAVAAVATFGLFTIAELPQTSWAVVSALFVIQPNVGGTVSAALGRIAGTALGTALGLACVYVIGVSGWASAAGLIAATASLGFITGFRPGLRYGLVPAAFILLAPDSEVIEKAWHGAAAIGIGAVIGTLSGLLVFPEPAHRAAEQHLGAALGRCGALLAAAVASLLGDPERDGVEAASERIDAELWAAGGIADQSRYPTRVRRHPAHPRPRELLRAVERLWHSLLLMARADREPLPEEARRELGPALQAFAATGGAYLEALGEALTRNATPPASDPTAERVQELDEALRRWRDRSATPPLESRQAERVFTLAFAVEELSRNFDEVAGLFSGPGARARWSGAAPDGSGG